MIMDTPFTILQDTRGISLTLAWQSRFFNVLHGTVIPLKGVL